MLRRRLSAAEPEAAQLATSSDWHGAKAGDDNGAKLDIDETVAEPVSGDVRFGGSSTSVATAADCVVIVIIDGMSLTDSSIDCLIDVSNPIATAEQSTISPIFGRLSVRSAAETTLTAAEVEIDGGIPSAAVDEVADSADDESASCSRNRAANAAAFDEPETDGVAVWCSLFVVVAGSDVTDIDSEQQSDVTEDDVSAVLF
jgi:hypothetical protein